VKVVCGMPKTDSEHWNQPTNSRVQELLGTNFDSVRGGPHRPFGAGPYAKGDEKGDDSKIVVTYDDCATYAEFWVTFLKKDT